jgi:hypothetical protein
MRRFYPFASILGAGLLAVVAAAWAAWPNGPLETVLAQAASPAELRSRLMSFAAGAEKTDPAAAGEAWYDAGRSYSRASLRDSAIACWRRSLVLRKENQDRYALADALIQRRSAGDLDEANTLLQAAVTEVQGQPGSSAARYVALLAWGRYLAGAETEARDLFAQVEPSITPYAIWRYRYARALTGTSDWHKIVMLLRPLAIASRGLEPETSALLESTAQAAGRTDALIKDVLEQLRLRDEREGRLVERMGGRRIKFAAADTFPLSGVLLEAPGKSRHPVAIVLVAPEDTLADYDSLGVALRDDGYTTLLLNARGGGWSVAADCALPEAWIGREERMILATARDLREAVRATALAAAVDTEKVVLVAGGSMALPAAMAAQDRRVRALALLSPDPDVVDRGLLVATLARRRMPVFLQHTPEDYPNFEYIDFVYHATAEALSRVSDARAPGTGAAAFRFDRKLTPRFVQWLGEAMKAPATPPARPRRG